MYSPTSTATSKTQLVYRGDSVGGYQVFTIRDVLSEEITTPTSSTTYPYSGYWDVWGSTSVTPLSNNVWNIPPPKNWRWYNELRPKVEDQIVLPLVQTLVHRPRQVLSLAERRRWKRRRFIQSLQH